MLEMPIPTFRVPHPPPAAVQEDLLRESQRLQTLILQDGGVESQFIEPSKRPVEIAPLDEASFSQVGINLYRLLDTMASL